MTNQEQNKIIMRGCLNGAQCNGCNSLDFADRKCKETNQEIPVAYINADGFIAYVKPTNCPKI